MKTAYEVIITNGNNETVVDIGVVSISSANALQTVLKKYGDKISMYQDLSITINPQEDNNG